MSKPRLQKIYDEKLKKQLKDTLGISNVMRVPKVEKIVLNVGVRDAVTDSKTVKVVAEHLEKIAGQKPVITVARKSIAGFKIREGMPLGVKVTLRRARMYEFLDRLINLALPTVRDFQGVTKKFDKNGNYNLGIKDCLIFPEIDFGSMSKFFGLNVTIATSAQSPEEGYELLKLFGMPFVKDNKGMVNG